VTVSSQSRVNVGTLDFLNPADPGIMIELPQPRLLSLSIECQRLKDGTHADLAPVLEAIGKGFLGAVDTHDRTIDLMLLYAGGKCLP